MSTSGWCVDLRGVNPESRGIASYARNLCNGLAEFSGTSGCQGFLADASLSGWDDLKLSRVDRLARGLRLLPDLFVNRLVGGSYVGVIHDLIPLECTDLDWRSRKHKWLGVWSRWMRRRAAHAKALICVSHATASSVRTFWPELESKITVIHEGVPRPCVDPVRPAEITEPGFVLMVARRDPHKNLPRAIRAWSQVDAQQLIIVGSPDKRYPEVDASINQSKRRSHIIVLPYVTESELEWLYGNASALLFPSLVEGFGLPPMEAALRSCPVISSDCGAVPELLQGQYRSINPKSETCIAQALTEVALRRPSYRNPVIPALREHARKVVDLIDLKIAEGSQA